MDGIKDLCSPRALGVWGEAYLLSRSCSVLGSGSSSVSGRGLVMGQAAMRTPPQMKRGREG